MAPNVIDLTGLDSDEEDLEDSPRKSVLARFKPRKEKQSKHLDASHDLEKENRTLDHEDEHICDYIKQQNDMGKTALTLLFFSSLLLYFLYFSILLFFFFFFLSF